MLWLLALAAAASGQQAAGPAKAQPAPATIEGRVIRADTGEPLRKAIVILDGIGSGVPPQGLLTDAEGNFTIRGIPPGRYGLSATRNGFLPADHGQKAPGRPGLPIQLAPGEHRKDLVLSLVRGGVITGKVTDEDGEPLSQVHVYLVRPGYADGQRLLTPVNTGETNDLGQYRFHGLVPGRYFLYASYNSQPSRVAALRTSGGAELRYAPIYYPNTSDASAAAPVQVGPGQEAPNIDLRFSLAPTFRVSGKVVAHSGAGDFQGSVMIVPEFSVMSLASGTQTFNLTRAKSGEFEFRGVMPGQYTLIASLRGERPLRGVLPLSVGSGDVEGVQVAVQPAFRLTGRLRIDDPARKDPGRTAVLLRRRSTVSMLLGTVSARVSDDGAFTLDVVEPGSYTLAVAGPAEDLYLKAARLGDADVLLTLELLQPPAAPLEIVLGTDGAVLNGTVLDEKDQPAALAAVVLAPSGERARLFRLYKNATADERGRFTMKGISPGSYKLYAWDQVEPGQYFDPDFMRAYENSGETLSLQAREAKTLQLRLLANTVGY